jgi:hypothetical protein
MYNELATKVVNGDVNPLKAYIELKNAQAELEAALKTVQPLAIDEADKYKEKSFKAFGAIIEKRNAPSTWDFSQVAAYQQAKQRLKYIEDVSKAGGGYDAETTEEITKAIRIEGKSSIAVKLVKVEA